MYGEVKLAIIVLSLSKISELCRTNFVLTSESANDKNITLYFEQIEVYEIQKEYNLYEQRHCGCRYSLKNK